MTIRFREVVRNNKPHIVYRNGKLVMQAAIDGAYMDFYSIAPVKPENVIAAARSLCGRMPEPFRQ